jgi:DNA-binding GntR family transcriptional regulator
VESNEDHFKMLDAIKNRDGDAVEKLVRDHILKGKKAVLDQFVDEGKEQKSA